MSSGGKTLFWSWRWCIPLYCSFKPLCESRTRLCSQVLLSPLRNTDTLSGKPSPLLAACSAVVSYTPMLHFHQTGNGLSRSAWWERTGCLCLKPSEGISYLSLEPYLTWSVQTNYKLKYFCKRRHTPVLFCFLIQRNISKQRSSKENVSFLSKKKNCLVSDFWISSWGHGGGSGITASCCPRQGDKDIYHQGLKWACQSPEVERSPHRKGPLRHRAGGGGLDIHPLNKGQCITKPPSSPQFFWSQSFPNHCLLTGTGAGWKSQPSARPLRPLREAPSWRRASWRHEPTQFTHLLPPHHQDCSLTKPVSTLTSPL